MVTKVSINIFFVVEKKISKNILNFQIFFLLGLYLDTSDKFFTKSISSFQSGKFYQAVKEFTGSLSRIIETNSFSLVENNLNQVIPILEANSLFHESEQIVQFYFIHLKKHKKISLGLYPFTQFLLHNLSQNTYPHSTLSFFRGFIDYTTNSLEKELVDYIKNNYDRFHTIGENFLFNQAVIEGIFQTLILTALFPEAEKISYSVFLNNLTSEKNLDNILHSLLILGINGNIEKAIEFLKTLRKTLPITIQKSSNLFQCSSEFLLACSSKDFEWIKELQSHFSELLKEKIIKILVLNLIKRIFPEQSKISLFDFFK